MTSSPADQLVHNLEVGGSSKDHQLHNIGVLKCTKGFLDHYSPVFTKLSNDLERLNTAQEILTVDVKTEREKIEKITNDDLTEMIGETGRYRLKAGRLQEEMLALSERSERLRKRAAKLQDQKQKEALRRENKRVQDIEREKELVARPAKK